MSRRHVPACGYLARVDDIAQAPAIEGRRCVLAFGHEPADVHAFVVAGSSSIVRVQRPTVVDFLEGSAL